MKRIFLFIVTNLAVLVLLSVAIFVIERVFGVQPAGGGLGGLLVFAAVFGFGGALISLNQAHIGMPQSHVSNGDMVTLALLQGVLNTFVIFLARVIGIFASIIVSWYSRRREFRADRGGADLAGTGGMIAALQALKQSHGVPMPPKCRP